MLTNKQKTQLRQEAAQNKNLIKFNIGKDTIDSNVIDTLEKAIFKHELIKINILKSALVESTKEDIIGNIILKLKAELVQQIGKTALIYRHNPKLKDGIKLVQ